MTPISRAVLYQNKPPWENVRHEANVTRDSEQPNTPGYVYSQPIVRTVALDQGFSEPTFVTHKPAITQTQ